MILALALAAVLAPATPAQPAPGPVTPATTSSPVPGTATAATDDAAPDLDQLRQMYRDTCEAREYGAYDDMCDQLRQQVRDAEREAAREARRHPKVTPFPVSPP